MEEIRIFDFSYDNFDPRILFFGKGTRSSGEQEHTHECMEISYILSGEGKYFLDGNIFPVSGGDVLFINPGIKHNGLLTDIEKPTVEFFLCFEDFQFPPALPNQIPLSGGSIIRSVNQEIQAEIDILISRILLEQQSTDFCKHSLIKAYCTQLILLLMRPFVDVSDDIVPDSSNSAGNSKKADEIMKYMEQHFREKISLDEIARNLYLSPSYICRVFKEERGDSPINYLIKKRMDCAKTCLETDQNAAIKKVASFAGYDDIYHFSKVFKKFYGMSPAEYKKNYHKFSNDNYSEDKKR